jgi:uncharacterized protein (TIGR03437 family)
MLAAIMVLAALGRPLGSAAPRDNRPAAKILNAPLSFEPNQGQAASTVQFLARGSGYALFLTPRAVVLNLEPHRASNDTLRMSLIGANADAKAVGLAQQPGVVSYFIGNDPQKWRTGIPTYGKVDYAEVYPGVDLVFYGNQRQLEYDFVVAPGADASRIDWRIDGARVRLDAEGNLVLESRHGQATFRKPVLYQMDGTKRVAVEGAFAVRRNEVRFRLGSYDRSRALTIDPVLSYATYLAGTGNDYIGRPTCCGIGYVATSQGLAVDSAGSVYVTGRTGSVDFPMANALPGLGSFPARLPGTGPTYTPSTFVTKFSPDGSSLVYSTYLGGNSEDDGYAIAVDSAGEAYVAGSTTSANFPITSGAYQTLCGPTVYAGQAGATCPGSMNAFVTKLNATGTKLVYSTFLGGYGNTWATGIAVDAAGRAYVAGSQDTVCNASQMSTCFPTTSGAVIGTTSMYCCAYFTFISVFDPTGAKLLYSTLFGDLNDLVGTAVASPGSSYAAGAAVDSNGYFYLFGETEAGRLPTTLGVVQPTSGPLDPTGGHVANSRGYIAKFNPVSSTGGSSLVWATYLGGHTATVGDFVSGLAVDSAGNVYVGGATNSSDFPVTTGAYSTTCGYAGSECVGGYLTKLNSSATQIVWSTYIGGAKQDGSDTMSYTGPVQLDGKGNVYFIGTTSSGFPLINPVEPWAKGAGAVDLVVVELDPTGSQLLFSSVVGSGGLDGSGPGGMAVDSAGNIYIGGWINGPDLVTTHGAFQTTDPTPVCCTVHGYVAKITPSTGPQITVVGTAPDVFNAATLQTGGIAPNEFISLKGAGLGPATGVSGLNTQLGGSSVSIGGTAAFLTYAQDGQINVLVPFRVSGLSNTTIQVTYNGVVGNSVTVPVVASSPGIFTQQYGPGQAWVVNQNSTFNSASNAAPRGTYVAFWVTGQGLVNTTLADGAQPTGPPYPTPLLPLSVTLGGVAVPAANIAFDGLIYSGEVQINLLIPANAPTGSAVPLVVTIGGASSRTDATIAIQ